MTHCVAIVDGSGDVSGVSFPDLPGCHGGGSTIDHAIRDAVSALGAYPAEVAADG